MLVYKIGKDGLKREMAVVALMDDEGNPYPIYERDGQIYIRSYSHGLVVGDTLYFERNDGPDIQYYGTYVVSEVIDDDNFAIKTPELLKIDFTSAARFAKRYSPDPETAAVEFLAFFVLNGNNHIFAKNKGNNLVRYSLHGGDDYTGLVKCTFLYEDDFLYTLTSEELVFLNETGKTIFVFLNEKANEEILQLSNLRGSHWQYEEGVVMLQNCIVPVDANGRDIGSRIYWEAESEELCEILAKNAPYLTFYSFDERFIENTFEETDNGFICYPQDGVKVMKNSISLNMIDLFTQDFSLGVRQDEEIRENIVEKVKKDSKNAIIDYEKQCFTPTCKNGENTCDVSRIIFKLHFRKREIDENFSYGEWKTNDDLFWNGIDYENGSLVPKYEGDPSDLLGYLGFSDDDVFYKKKKIENTFIRLSFYDTTDRRTQNLLYTSTIFANSSQLYSDYVENVKFGVEKKSEREIGEDEEEIQVYPDEYVFVEDARKRLCAEFSCASKYDSNISSDGFYLYLFPGIVGDSGETTIYMKVEFNHAKYGYTIPFVHTESNTSADLKVNYSKTDGGNRYTDMASLFNDIYIPIVVKYDSNDRRYVWEYKNENAYDGDKLILNLFEPKINSGQYD